MMLLESYPVHLGLGATATPCAKFTGDAAWYAAYSSAHAADGPEGRLVSMHRFTAPWTVWEMHPLGTEVVVCTAGRIALIQAASDGSTVRLELSEGDYAINPPGVWHTADVDTAATVLFITAGSGTEVRPR